MPHPFSPHDHQRAVVAMRRGCDRRAGRQGVFILTLAAFWYLGPGLYQGLVWALEGSVGGFVMFGICLSMLAFSLVHERKGALASTAMLRECRILELSGPVIAREHHQEQDWNEHAGSFTRDYYSLTIRPAAYQLRREDAVLWVRQGDWQETRQGELVHALVVSYSAEDDDLEPIRIHWPERPAPVSLWSRLRGWWSALTCAQLT